MTCPRCHWPVSTLDLCESCRAEDQARMRGLRVEIGEVPAREVRQMGRTQVVMAAVVVGRREAREAREAREGQP